VTTDSPSQLIARGNLAAINSSHLSDLSDLPLIVAMLKKPLIAARFTM
jgi:hypothetical protein